MILPSPSKTREQKGGRAFFVLDHYFDARLCINELPLESQGRSHSSSNLLPPLIPCIYPASQKSAHDYPDQRSNHS